MLLIVEKGEPYKKGTVIEISPGRHMLGRPWQTHQPEIPFTNLHISKRHALISYDNNECTLIDLHSKLGTQVNGSCLNHEQLYPLKNGDTISLARGIVIVRLVNNDEAGMEKTIDLINSELENQYTYKSLLIDVKRRQVLLEGKQLRLYGKEIELLLLLYENRNRAVSYNEIRSQVWPERPLSPEYNAPEVGKDEINALVYRLRKRLDKYESVIVTVPRYGYRMD